MTHRWPWRWDPRPHGWFKAGGLEKFGPLPERERADETWPPQKQERVQVALAVARAVRALGVTGQK